MIPTKTGAAAAVGLVLPELNGKLDGYRDARADDQRVDRRPVVHRRRATPRSTRSTRIMKAAAERRAEGHPRLQHRAAGLVDFNHNPASSIFDATLTKVSGRLVKVS